MPTHADDPVYTTPDNVTHITPRDPDGDPDPARPWVIELPRWIYNAIVRRGDILAVHPDYFQLTGGLERAAARGAPDDQPSGVPQGSLVADLVAELVMARLLAALPADCVLVAFADNVVILCRTREQARATVTLCEGALCDHPAGRLDGNIRIAPFYRDYGGGFEYLGYKFRAHLGWVLIRPKNANLAIIRSGLRLS